MVRVDELFDGGVTEVIELGLEKYGRCLMSKITNVLYRTRELAF